MKNPNDILVAELDTVTITHSNGVTSSPRAISIGPCRSTSAVMRGIESRYHQPIVSYQDDRDEYPGTIYRLASGKRIVQVDRTGN